MGKGKRLKDKQKSLMPHKKGGRMIPDWFLQVLSIVIGIIASGALWYFLSQKLYYHALWSGIVAIEISIILIALFIHNGIAKKEIQAKTPVYYGEIVPSNEQSQPLPQNVPKGTITLMLGDKLRVLTAQSQNYIFSKNGEPFLSVGIKEGVMRMSACIVDSTNQNVVRIIDNEFQANPERAFNPKQPDKHSLVVRDTKGVEVLNIRFLNSKTMRIVGRFQIPGSSEPILILPHDGVRWPGGGGISRLTIDMTSSKGGFIAFK